MTSVAKIFVVVNLILGVAAFGSAATLLGAQDDYKTALEKASEQFQVYEKEKTDEIAELNSQLAQQNARAGEAVSRAQNLEADLTDKKNRLNQSETTNSQLRATIDKLSQQVEQMNSINQSNKEFLDKLTEQSRRATEDANKARQDYRDEVANRVNLEQQVANQNEQIKDLSAKIGDLEGKLREANFALTQFRTRYGPIVEAAEGASGEVINVKGNLVQISVGSADRVKPGDTYHVRRGGTYVGSMRITKVTKDSAVGTFDDRYTGAGAPPQVGDTAYPDR